MAAPVLQLPRITVISVIFTIQRKPLNAMMLKLEVGKAIVHRRCKSRC